MQFLKRGKKKKTEISSRKKKKKKKKIKIKKKKISDYEVQMLKRILWGRHERKGCEEDLTKNLEGRRQVKRQKKEKENEKRRNGVVPLVTSVTSTLLQGDLLRWLFGIS